MHEAGVTIAAGWFVVLSIFSSTSPALPLYTAAAVPFVADGPPPTAPRPTGSTDHAGGSDPLRLLLPPVDCGVVSYRRHRIDRQVGGDSNSRSRKMMMQMVQMHQMMMVVQMVMVMVVMVQVPQPMQQMADGGRVVTSDHERESCCWRC
uniref:Secreted protein n=1 Tax=Anopheles coluzzii TaxID=1518534 RepID=A0A8W7P064_ANOCL